MNPRALTGWLSALAQGAEKVLGWFGLGAFHPRNLAKRPLARVMAKATVCAGPFAGMKYVRASVGSALLPKLLGTYESELHSIVERWCRTPPPLVVDVGAAEGYYAVGLTHRCPTIRCVAFEAEAAGRELLGELARLNGVAQRIDVRGICTLETLASVLDTSEQTLLIMDVEGAEKELLDPVALPALTRCSILVELHPQFHPQIAEEISARFAASHEQQLIHERLRAVNELPFGPLTLPLFGRWLILASAEYRPVQMAWLWMQPRQPEANRGSENDRREPDTVAKRSAS